MNNETQINYQNENNIENLKKLSQVRELRAKEILMVGKPRILSEEEFIVPASDGKHNYRVLHLDAWSCECLDFKERCQKIGIYCKHIKAMQQFLRLKNNQIEEDFSVEGIIEEDKIICAYCKSANITKQGFRKNKNSVKQKYLCGACNRFFINEPVKHIKGNTKLLCMTMDLYYKGLSLRDIKDTIGQFYGLDLHHETIRRWIVKFTRKMNDYVETKTPELGTVWNTDEQMIKVGKKHLWNWNTIDQDTKFWIANNVTESRTIKEARQQFQKVKNMAKDQKPEVLITDGLPAYRKAIKKEFKTHKDRMGRPQEDSVLHIGNAGIRSRITNNQVERLNSTFREFDKVRRGFYSKDTLNNNLDGMRLFYNYIRPHQSLNGLTPSQKANIDLKLNKNKWLGLLKQMEVSKYGK